MHVKNQSVRSFAVQAVVALSLHLLELSAFKELQTQDVHETKIFSLGEYYGCRAAAGAAVAANSGVSTFKRFDINIQIRSLLKFFLHPLSPYPSLLNRGEIRYKMDRTAFKLTSHTLPIVPSCSVRILLDGDKFASWTAVQSSRGVPF